MSEEDNTEGTLSRWSKRKRELAETRKNVKIDASQEEQDAELEAREMELVANRGAAEEIDLDTIDEESDLSLFMKEGVPEALKKAALAKLWRSNPVFANIDGLVDYDDNFADPNLIMKTFTSAYQIGKGYLKEVIEEDEIESPVEVADVQEPILSSDTDEIEENNVEEIKDVDHHERTESIENTETLEISEEETASIPSVPLRVRLGLADIVD